VLQLRKLADPKTIVRQYFPIDHFSHRPWQHIAETKLVKPLVLKPVSRLQT
jgi:hypothetical protein